MSIESFIISLPNSVNWYFIIAVTTAGFAPLSKPPVVYLHPLNMNNHLFLPSVLQFLQISQYLNQIVFELTHKHQQRESLIFAPPLACDGSDIPRPTANDSINILHPFPAPSTPPIIAFTGTTTSSP